MSFDALTLAAVRDELGPLLTGARMQKLVFVDELSLAVEFYAPGAGRTAVLLSARLDHNRIQRIGQLPARGVDRDTPFILLARKHLRNARVLSVSQPPLERVFELDCEQRDPSNRPYRVVLIVEAMGRRSNLVLVDADGGILDAARRTPPSRNARRPILPHLPYSPPPPQDRLLPEAISAETFADCPPGGLAKRLADRVAGLSPLAARELAFRVADADPPKVAETVRTFTTSHAWSPSVAYDSDGAPLDYAPYELTHLSAAGAQLQKFESISDAMTAFYAAERPRKGDPLAAERKALLAPIERTMQTTTRRIAALEHQLDMGQAERDPLREAGELILTHQAELPLGTTQFEGIALDPTLTAVENAQAYFARYRKARDAEERVPELLEEARNSLEHLANLRTLVEVADQMDAIRALRREVATATGAKQNAKAVSKSTPYRRVTLDGWEALIGASAEGNATVTFDLARGDDLWLHARGVPGAHVILRGNGSPPDDVLERAAELAAHHSASRASSAVEVDVAPRRYVKKVPGGPPGLVRYANERTLRVMPRSG
jgi:predicted ribosome quality control (RQC) complex YloA/Tae2 family protein